MRKEKKEAKKKYPIQPAMNLQPIMHTKFYSILKLASHSTGWNHVFTYSRFHEVLGTYNGF